MKRIFTTALIAGAAAFIPTQSQAGDRPTRVDNDGRGAISVTIEDGQLSGLFVRHDDRDHRPAGDLVRYRGTSYVYQRGQFFVQSHRGWQPVAAPIGIVVRDLPQRGVDHQWIRGDLYEVVGGTYYQRTRYGYQVVAKPSPNRGGHGSHGHHGRR